MDASARNRKRTRGVAAVEFALVMPILLLLLVTPLYLGRYFYHYTVAQHAAQNSARYLSQVPLLEIVNPDRAKLAANVANEMVIQMLAELAPGPVVPNYDVSCGSNKCAGVIRPTTVTVSIQILVVDIFFPTAMSMPFEVTVRTPYIGR